MPTNMTLLKCLEYPYFWICSVDDTKVDIDCICIRSELLLQLGTNEHCIKTGKQMHRTKIGQPNALYKDGKSKQTNIGKSHLFIITIQKINLEK
jgi:hypothetical protein